MMEKRIYYTDSYYVSGIKKYLDMDGVVIIVFYCKIIKK